MSLLVRTLMIWLLVLAVPAQGAAAATMAFCGPNHQGAAAMPATQMQLAEPAEHVHAESGAAVAHAHHDVMAQTAEPSSDAASFEASAKVSDPGTHKCSACASCCSVGAILNSVLAVPAPVFTSTVFPTMEPAVDTFVVDGPDRPPRTVLA